MHTILVIPARYESSRLPGKPLVDLCGTSMIVRTYRRCAQAFPAEAIYIATDDERIRIHCEEQGIQVVMTSDQCLTGTDRVAEVAAALKPDYVINVQGDEPLFNPEDIRQVVQAAKQHPGKVLNGFCPIKDEAAYNSRSVPKVVFRDDGRLLYMSRSPVPGNKQQELIQAYRQICIYGFPVGSLQAFAARKKKTPFEAIEDIEILRFLEMGYEVQMVELSDESVAVDHPEDVEKVIEILQREPA